jgi:Phosphotransferase enzyme family
LSFSLPHLVEEALKACNKTDVSDIKLISCGGINKVYVLSFSDGTDAIARLPYLKSKEQRDQVWSDRLKSEVATMKYAKRHLTPEFAALIPQVYAWNPSSDNPIGQPYIIMQRMRGSTLGSCWKETSTKEKEVVAKQLAQFTFAMQNIGTEFSEIGSLYYDEEKDSFYVGPFIAKFPANLIYDHLYDLDCGPWATSSDFMLAQIRNQLCINRTSVFPKADKENILPHVIPTTVFDVVTHLNNISYFAAQFRHDKINDVRYSDKSRSLFHDDLHVDNILIDPETMALTGILDWEGITISPDWRSISIPICFEGPEVYSDESELDCVQVDHRSHYKGQTELRDWYTLVRSSLDPGFHHKVAAYRSWRRVYEGIFVDWTDLRLDEGEWIADEIRRQKMI